MVRKKIIFSFLFIFTTIIILSADNAFSAGAVENVLNANKKLDQKVDEAKHKKNSNKQQQGLITGANKPEWIPDAPNENEIVYKMLFDDGFANIVEDYAEMGEYGDNDIDPIDLRSFNRMYKAGNDETNSQMEAMEAEKKTIAGEMIDKELVDTERTRVLAYLTTDQIDMAGLFNIPSQRAYIAAVADDLREERRQEIIAQASNEFFSSEEY